MSKTQKISKLYIFFFFFYKNSKITLSHPPQAQNCSCIQPPSCYLTLALPQIWLQRWIKQQSMGQRAPHALPQVTYSQASYHPGAEGSCNSLVSARAVCTQAQTTWCYQLFKATTNKGCSFSSNWLSLSLSVCKSRHMIHSAITVRVAENMAGSSGQ